MAAVYTRCVRVMYMLYECAFVPMDINEWLFRPDVGRLDTLRDLSRSEHNPRWSVIVSKIPPFNIAGFNVTSFG